MRLSGLLLLGFLEKTQAGIGDGRQLARLVMPYTVCEAKDGELELENGEKECKFGYCKLKKCEQGYHRTKTVQKQGPKAKCIANSKGTKWNKELFKCRTCADMNPLANNPDFVVSCGYQSLARGTYSLKRCTFKCRNGGLIQPLGVKQANNVRCGCNVWEKDRQCHWRLRGRTFDIDNTFNFNKWSCSGGSPKPTDGSNKSTAAPTFKPTTTTVRPATKQTTLPPSTQPSASRIPTGLECLKTPAMMRMSPDERTDDRIVGGVEAIQGSWPWIVRLVINNSWLCGGTILDDRTILTAGHCCDPAKKIIAISGDHNRYEDETSQRMHEISKIIIHPEYALPRGTSPKNDVCILKTLRSMNTKFDKAAKPACLPTRGQKIKENTICWTAGWGKTKSGGWGGARVLNEVDLKIFDDSTCKATEIGRDFVDSQMVCAGWEEGGKDGCQGDSGGPLICEVDNQPVLIGATSWGWGCAQANKPGVWAEVSNYIDWILDHTE